MLLSEHRAEERENMRRVLTARAKVLEQVIREFKAKVVSPIKEDLGLLKEGSDARAWGQAISLLKIEQYVRTLQTRLQDLGDTIDSVAEY